MKRINFNIKDRKVLILGLCLVLVCVFTLTIAYSALSAVLTIQGNARVSAADWDIYLNNPRVTSGSATTNIPVIKTSSTLEFSTTLNMPGDFYEFVVDVVNGGDIDAMIENVVKTPDLTAEQAKFLKYEVSYQNGEAITTKQLLAKDTTMPIKVRVEYRKDLSNSDLPTGQVVLDLALTLEYIQSDGTGSSVNNNGAKVVSANGDINDIGTIVTIGSEQFYTIGTEGDNVKLLSMYNLYVGNEVRLDWDEDEGDYYENIVPFSNPTGMQDSTMLGIVSSGLPYRGTTAFADSCDKKCNYSESLVCMYVNNYRNKLEMNYKINIIEARLINVDELIDKNTIACDFNTCATSPYPWVSSMSYWVYSDDSDTVIFGVRNSDQYFGDYSYSIDYQFGVRPVIVISKDYFN